MFITFEGTEGCGKSTLIQHLANRLKAANLPHVITREPGGSSVAESIRNLILHQEMNAMAELFLYEAARAEHFHQTVLPALKAGKIVICDRFTDSTLAYQGFARGLDLKTIEQLNRIATHNTKPDLTFFLDLPVEIGLSRASDPNKFEREGINFQKKVRKGFLYSIKKNPKRWRVLKVKQKSPDELADEVMAILIQKRGRS